MKTSSFYSNITPHSTKAEPKRETKWILFHFIQINFFIIHQLLSRFNVEQVANYDRFEGISNKISTIRILMTKSYKFHKKNLSRITTANEPLIDNKIPFLKRH